MRYTKGLLLILLSIVITSCNLNEYKKLQLDKNKYYFSFDQEVPNNFQLKIKKVFGYNFEKVNYEKIHINLLSFDLNKYEVYSGTSLRAMEIELKAKLNFSIDNSNNIKTINSMKRFSAIELNPLAQNQMSKFMEEEIINDVIEQLILEVNLIDL
ncbi:hypothetical protein OA869_01810 [Gammaproteobacteria bacterium]|nr:hypothetical protein [Gammaproteobacteria bacterium]